MLNLVPLYAVPGIPPPCPHCIPRGRPGYDSVMPAQAGIQYDSWPPAAFQRGLDPCLRRGDIVTSVRHIALHTHTLSLDVAEPLSAVVR